MAFAPLPLSDWTSIVTASPCWIAIGIFCRTQYISGGCWKYDDTAHTTTHAGSACNDTRDQETPVRFHFVYHPTAFGGVVVGGGWNV